MALCSLRHRLHLCLRSPLPLSSSILSRPILSPTPSFHYPSGSTPSPCISFLAPFQNQSFIVPFQSRLFRASAFALSTRGRGSNLNDTDEIGPDTILFEGCDYNHWLITVDFPKDPAPTREEMIETYVQTAAKVFGSVEEAKKKIYALSTTTYQGFQVLCSEETSEKFRGLPGVVFILPDSYIDPVNKEYGGDKYVNGEIFPRPPPVYYGRQGRRGDRNRDFNSSNRPPRQNYGPPQQNYSLPQYPPPQQNYGPTQNPPPQQNFGPTQNSPPQQNYSPQQNFPQQNFGPQPNFPPQQNYRPQQNYSPQQTVTPQVNYGPQQSVPPQSNYGPQQNFSPQSNYVPQQNFPPQQNYGQRSNYPQQQNYSPQDNYPPQQNYGPRGTPGGGSFERMTGGGAQEQGSSPAYDQSYPRDGEDHRSNTFGEEQRNYTATGNTAADHERYEESDDGKII